MAGRRRRSIKQSYAIIYQRLFSQEDHTFDPKKEDWSCNKIEFLTPVQIQSHVQSVASSDLVLLMGHVTNQMLVWFSEQRKKT